jgi:C1A family cysteine protease
MNEIHLPIIGTSLRSPDDPYDWVYEHITNGTTTMFLSEIPEEFDLRQYTQPARDQGIRGTCAAFTASAIKEITEKRESEFDGWMSPEFIYYHRKNKPGVGMYGRDVFQILQRIGSVPEDSYPYSTKENKTPPPTRKMYKEAAKYKIHSYARVKTCDGLKRALLEIGPCYLMLPLYTSRPKFWIAKEDEKPNGGHALTAIGYTKEGIILKNSWGFDWNQNGHIILNFDEWDIVWECWVPIDKYANKSEIQAGLSLQSIKMKEEKAKKNNIFANLRKYILHKN